MNFRGYTVDFSDSHCFLYLENEETKENSFRLCDVKRLEGKIAIGHSFKFSKDGDKVEIQDLGYKDLDKDALRKIKSICCELETRAQFGL